jgi:ABC-type amino acid transport substrate-binding protein
MRTRFSLLLAVALVGSLGCAEVASAQLQKVRIATEGAFAPFNYKDTNGELQGFDVDIAKALCSKAKFDCTIVAQDWDGIIPGLLAKKYDAIIASMPVPRGSIVDEGAGIGIRKGDTKLKDAFNAAIKAIRADGTYKKINDKYFSFDVYGPEPPS